MGYDVVFEYAQQYIFQWQVFICAVNRNIIKLVNLVSEMSRETLIVSQ